MEKLTKDQELLMHKVREEWLGKIFSCKTGLNEESAKKGIEWLYEISGLEKPMIIKVDSPLACQYAAHMLKNMDFDTAQVRTQVRGQVEDQVLDQDQVFAQIRTQVRTQVWDQVRDQVRDQVLDQDQVFAQIRTQVRTQLWAQVRTQVLDQVRDQDQVLDQVWAQVRGQDQVFAQIRTQVGDQVWDQVLDQVRGQDQVFAQIRTQVRGQGFEFESFSDYGNIWDYGWLSFYDFFKRVGIVKHSGLEEMLSLLNSGVYDMIQLKGVCIYCPLPSKIKRSQDFLHSVDGVAIEWNDGYKLNFVRGVYLKPELFKKLSNKEYTFEDFTKEKNEETKNAIMVFMEEKFGGEYLFDFLSKNLKEIDTYTNKKDEKYLEGTTKGMNIGVYTLYKGMVNDVNLAYVRCYCPSTDRMFFLSVEDRYDNAKDAIASLYRCPQKLVNEIKYIQRQGERYSTIFTDRGNEVLSNMEKEEIEDLVSITGDRYFELMKYEY